jgi:hypothetical protein
LRQSWSSRPSKRRRWAVSGVGADQQKSRLRFTERGQHIDKTGVQLWFGHSALSTSARRISPKADPAGRGGRWEPTPLRDTKEKLVTSLVEQFGWVLTPDESPREPGAN